MNPSENDCKYCGKPATQFVFAQFVCEKEECVGKAREERGGPGGHQFQKEHSSASFGMMDFDE
jgi:hypothetical protein